MKNTEAVSIIVPGFFSPDETAATIEIAQAALDTEVADSGLRRELSSGDAHLPIQIALQFVGDLGMHVLADATWAGIELIFQRLHKRFPGRKISVELRAKSPSGKAADYLLAGNGSDEALHSIVTDVERDVRGERVAYDVDEGWLTWEEWEEKRRRKRSSEEPQTNA